MKDFSQLKQSIIAAIRANGVGAITGPVLQEQLLGMVDAMEQSEFLGIATPNTTPTTDAKSNHFYIAVAEGDYSAFVEELTLQTGDVLLLAKSADESEWTATNLTGGLMQAIEYVAEAKQDLLTVGNGIDITENVISAKAKEGGKVSVSEDGLEIEYADDLEDDDKLVTAKAVNDKIEELSGKEGGYPVLDEDEKVPKTNLPDDVTYFEEGTSVDDTLIDEYERTLARAYEAIDATITARNRTYAAIESLNGMADQVNNAIQRSVTATEDSEEATEDARQAIAQLTTIIENANRAILEAQIATNATTTAIQQAQQAASQVISAGTYAQNQGDLAAQKANDAEQAATLAETKADLADTKAGYASDMGDYAKERGDYAEEAIDAAKGDFESMDARFVSAETDIENLEGDVEDAQGDITALKTEVQQARGGKASIDARLDIDEGKINNVADEVEDARGTADNLNTRLENIEGDIADINTTLDGAKGTAQSINARFLTLEGEIITATEENDPTTLL